MYASHSKTHIYIWAIIFSFSIAILLSIAPLFPNSLEPFKPQWVPLTLIFWIMYLPLSIGIFFAWMLGLFCDIAQGTLLGEHALAFSVLAFVTNQFQRRLILYSLLQQAFVIFLLIGMVLLIIFWVQVWASLPPMSITYWGSAFTSAFIWPICNYWFGLKLFRFNR